MMSNFGKATLTKEFTSVHKFNIFVNFSGQQRANQEEPLGYPANPD
jgi:hypothetical protein